MRVIVCGGRNYEDIARVRDVLDEINGRSPITVIIQGGARGADSLAKRWATENGTVTEEYKADWARHGRAAGPLRNREMLIKGHPELVVCFPGGSGTLNMHNAALARCIPVITVLGTR